MKSITYKILAAFLTASAVASCGKDADVPSVQKSTESVSAQNMAIDGSLGKSTSSSDRAALTDKNPDLNNISENQDLSSALGNKEIPYPVYPRGSHYRIGNENGLNIIVFETADTFEEVDAFYQDEADMSRLSAMTDYVRYSAAANDQDPWETTKPGIVIHEFSDQAERRTAGAKKESRTNIIMSFW